MATQVKPTHPHVKTMLRPGQRPFSFEQALYRRAIIEAIIKLDPRQQVHNPVMFTVSVAAMLATALFGWMLLGKSGDLPVIGGILVVWLWLVVFFANFAQALAGTHSWIRAKGLRQGYHEVVAKKLYRPECKDDYEIIPASSLSRGDTVLVEAGEIIPADGEVIEGIAHVDESALADTSVPIIREASLEHNTVTASTRVLSDWIVIRVQANPGENLLDCMFNLVEEAKYQDPPHRTFLKILLAGSTTISVLFIVILWLFSSQNGPNVDNQDILITIMTLITLLVALGSTTTGGLLSVVGIAGLDRLIQHNIIPWRGQDIMEVAGKVEVLLLDKSVTIVPGFRRAVAFIPLNKTTIAQLAKTARLVSLADRTPEGRSIIALAEKEVGAGDETEGAPLKAPAEAQVVPYSTETGLSGIDFNGTSIRKGTPDAITAYLHAHRNFVTPELNGVIERIQGQGGVPLVVTLNDQAIGVIHIRELVNKYLKARLVRLRQMGIKTVMVSDDPPLVAAAIAAEAGMDDFLSPITPAAKLNLVHHYRASGQRIAVTGKSVDEVAVLREADLSMAMNSGTHQVRQVANVVDLDSNPTKLIDLVEMGRQWLATRQVLTTFCMTVDVAKYFVLIPVLFATVYPTLDRFNFINLSTPARAILATVMFITLIIIAFMPLALRGLSNRLVGTGKLQHNLILLFGLGGLLAPFIGIKVIDFILAGLGLI